MNKIFKAPQNVVIPENHISLFLGGSIENGKADLWQDKLSEILINKFENIIILNPRRENWNSALKQDLTNTEFYEQVDWEYNSLESSDYILIYFQPNTYSPISLMELGLFAANKKVIVCCPEEFWRKGNVDFICKKFELTVIENYEDIVSILERDKNIIVKE